MYDGGNTHPPEHSHGIPQHAASWRTRGKTPLALSQSPRYSQCRPRCHTGLAENNPTMANISVYLSLVCIVLGSHRSTNVLPEGARKGQKRSPPPTSATAFGHQHPVTHHPPRVTRLSPGNIHVKTCRRLTLCSRPNVHPPYAQPPSLAYCSF
jgi:hypothetical protein